MDLKTILGVSATIVALVSYIPYFRDIFRGKTKPHTFSWLVWGILTAIGFAGQIAGGGGAGSWVTGFTALASFSIFTLALKRGEKNIVLADWLSLLGAAVALILWPVTKGPLLSVILITIIDAFGFAPTFRKSFTKPHEETSITYLLSATKFAIALVALDRFSVVTALYPIYLVLANGAFVLLLAVRRSQLKRRMQ